MFDSLKTHSHGAAGLSRGRYLVAACGTLAAMAAIAVLAPTARADIAGPPTTGDGVQPELVAGNPDCDDMGFFGLKDDDPEAGDKTISDGYLSVDLDYNTPNEDSYNFVDFVADHGVDKVIVKGGDNADVYVYDPEDTDDTGLHAPAQDNGTLRAISHVEFCYDVELEVSKTADTTFTRDYDWDIEKTCRAVGEEEPLTELTLSQGQSYQVNCYVTLSLLGMTDSDWAVSGDITVHNPHPTEDAEGVDVTDVISNGGDIPVTNVDCNGDAAGNGLPATIPAGGDLNCTYSADLPDGSDRTNTATADSTTPGFAEGSGPAPVTFGDPTTETDKCVDVEDDKIGDLGQVCVEDLEEGGGEYTIHGTYTIPSDETDECGEFDSTNTAMFTTDTADEEDDETGTDDHTIHVTVVGCNGDGGCSLTPGYWKTHSSQGPAPYDDNWANLGDVDGDANEEEEGEAFFKSGMSYHQVLWTSPAGNAYYILAHAYIAAVLNGLNGADTSEIDDELAAAKALFEQYKPADVAALKGKNGNGVRAQFISLAMTLDDYNNGVIGPGHCDDSTPA